MAWVKHCSSPFTEKGTGVPTWGPKDICSWGSWNLGWGCTWSSLLSCLASPAIEYLLQEFTRGIKYDPLGCRRGAQSLFCAIHICSNPLLGVYVEASKASPYWAWWALTWWVVLQQYSGSIVLLGYSVDVSIGLPECLQNMGTGFLHSYWSKRDSKEETTMLFTAYSEKSHYFSILLIRRQLTSNMFRKLAKLCQRVLVDIT